MLDDLKHIYSAEKTIRGRVLLSEALRVLENYSKMPLAGDIPVDRWELAKKMEMSPQGKIAFVRSIAVSQRVVRVEGSGCLWCGSRRLKELAEFPKEGFREYECKDCKSKFFR